MQALYWTWIWAITGGSPFTWTATITGIGRDSLVEATLSKIVLPSSGHAKASVWGWTVDSGWSWNPGIDGEPIVWIPGLAYVTFALEVNGQNTFAYMTAKVYAF